MHPRSGAARRGGCLALAFAAASLAGCTRPEPAAPAKREKGAAAPAVPGDSAERRTADDTAWKNKAADLLNRLDEKSAASLVPQLKALIEEREALDARARPHKTPLPPEENAAIQAKYGKQLREATLRYIEAAKVFDLATQKKGVAEALEKEHGIDVRRMRLVKK